jgi:hypothetical protein
MKARLLLVALVLTATAAMAPAAAADYTLGINATTISVGPGTQSSIQVEYSSFCIIFIFCPTKQSVGSSSGVTFNDPAGAACDPSTAGDLTRFSCDKRDRMQVTGTNGADEVSGSCVGATASLFFNGLDGEDEVRASSCGGSQVDLGPGDDRASVAGTLGGGAGNDGLTGSSGADVIDGGDGRDTVEGLGGTDTVNGGAGRDVLLPGTGNGDVVAGGSDTDAASYEDRTGAQPVTASLDGQANDGQPGENDTIGTDVENLIGGAGDDTLVGDGNPNEIEGGDGGDVIDPGAGPDVADGGVGNDRITARDGAQDRILCGDGNDQAVIDEFDTVVACEDVQASRELMPDVDADGVPAPLDCDDRDARRRQGFVDKPGNGLDEDCSGADAPFIRIFSPVQSTFETRNSLTRVTRLRVQAVPEGATIELRCNGGTRRGCFRGVKRFRAPRGDDLRDIRRPVRGRRLRAGAVLEVRILDEDSIGKVVRFTTNRGSRIPTSRSLCMVPGQNAPGRCPR